MTTERTVLRIATAVVTIAVAVAPGCTGEPDGGIGAGRGGAGGVGGASNGGSGGASGAMGGSAGASGTVNQAGSEHSTAGAGAASGGGAGASGASMGGSSTAGSSGSGGSPTGGSAGEAAGGVAGTGGDAGASTAGASGAAGSGMAGAPAAWVPTFTTQTLSMEHTAEGADVGDIDRDGVLDLVAGPTWYKGPTFAVGGQILATVPTFTRDQYSTFFLTFVADIDADMNPDIIGIGDAGGGNGSGTPNAHWYKNPGPDNLESPWQKTPIYDGLVSNESPLFVDLVGDAKKELVFMTDQRLGYAVPGTTPADPWFFQEVDSMSFGTPYVHGLGVGDVNGDGRKDIVERSGIWLQPANGNAWTRHAVDFGVGLTNRPNNWGGGQMAVYDVDGDGDSDVVTALAAHGYGLSWFEQEDLDTFTPHEILPPSATATSISQLHSLVVADMNGDGLLDVVTGKRYYAHPSTNPDPGTTEPPLVQWFELSRAGGTVTFTPHTIHMDSGTGCNFVVLDVTGEAKPDVFSTNKRGTFLHAQR
jgi:hypothetical protein